MAGGQRRVSPTGRGFAIAASVVAHTAVFLLLAWRLGSTPVRPETPIMNVELATLPRDRPREPAPPPEAKPKRATEPSRTFVPNLIAPPQVEPPSSAPRPSGQGEGVQQALRGLIGCDHANLVDLSAEERQRCRDRQVAQAQRLQVNPEARLNLDRRGAFATNPEPYLMRRPKNGCKARAGGDIAPMGAQGVASGLACAWSF